MVLSWVGSGLGKVALGLMEDSGLSRKSRMPPAVDLSGQQEPSCPQPSKVTFTRAESLGEGRGWPHPVACVEAEALLSPQLPSGPSPILGRKWVFLSVIVK